ncbi:Gyc32E, partial [Symbiodinium sp. CCMP2456]
LLLLQKFPFFIEKGQRSKFFYDQEQQESSKKIFCILCEMVPEHVILPMLKSRSPVDRRLSILFVMIENFDEQARILGPENLIKFLNNQFTMMDVICSNHQVTKIETVGEEYV